MSFQCGRCKLCGKFKAKCAMTINTNMATSSKGEQYKLKQQLCCKNFGIYQISCTRCVKENLKITGTYVGQTVTAFHKRFAGHRQNWSLANIKHNDKYALAIHYQNSHKVLPTFEEAFTVTSLEELEPQFLNQREDFWKHTLKANLNITRIVTANIH